VILFYTTNIQGNNAILEAEENRHCTQVLRKKVGEIVYFVDGKGTMYESKIIEVKKKACLLDIINTKPNFNTPNFYLHIAIAPTKNMDRLEWFVEKATEIGISEITPILCQHSERRKLRLDRLVKKAVSAMKQSLKAELPVINELTPFKKALLNIKEDSRQLIAQGGQNTAIQDNYLLGKPVYILIGPEGDFSMEELQWAKEAGFKGVPLGKSRLRTETAGLVACHTLNLLNQGD